MCDPFSARSDDVQRAEPVPGLPGPAGRREGLGDGPPVRQRPGQQRHGRAERRREAPRPSDHHQGQAAGDTEGCVRRHPETHQAHPGAAFARDRPQHESHPGRNQPV